VVIISCSDGDIASERNYCSIDGNNDKYDDDHDENNRRIVQVGDNDGKMELMLMEVMWQRQWCVMMMATVL